MPRKFHRAVESIGTMLRLLNQSVSPRARVRVCKPPEESRQGFSLSSVCGAANRDDNANARSIGPL